jgi:hypothetical protein
MLKGILTEMDSLDYNIDYVYLSKDDPTEKQINRDAKLFKGLNGNYDFAYIDIEQDWIESFAGFPYIMLLDKQGKVQFSQSGVWPDDQKERFIELFKEHGISK